MIDDGKPFVPPATGRAPEAESVPGTRFAEVRCVAETGSTNADVMALARQGGGEGLVLVADHQRAGRGRQGRTWSAPPGSSLLCSVLLRPPAPVAALVTLTMAVAAAEAVEAVTGIGPRLKWPNDLVWPGDGSGPDRKLAGILAEADWPLGVTASGGWRDPPPTERVTVVVGIGLNVRWGTVPEELAERAVALDHLVPADQVPDRPALLAALLVRLEARYAELVAGEAGPAAVLARWRARTCTLGRRVRVDLGVGDVEGTAVDVDAEGRLVVDGLDGVRRILAAGDVVHLR